MHGLEIRSPAMLDHLDQGIEVAGNALDEHADRPISLVPYPARHRPTGGDLGHHRPESHALDAADEGHPLPPPGRMAHSYASSGISAL